MSARSRSTSIVILAVLAVFYTVYFARDFLLPITVAVLFDFLLSPVVRALTRLRVEDCGGGVERAAGFGLDLVRRMVELGLDGSFELRARADGGTSAEVVFPTVRP